MRQRLVGPLFIVLVAAACVGDQLAAPGLFVRDDVGTGRWRMVSAGFDHSCALDIDGRAYCWGSNRFHQLGVEGTDATCGTTTVFACSLVPIPVASGRHFVSISAGTSHTCAISSDSVPYCWGGNQDGQLGSFSPKSAAPLVAGNAPMVAISAGAKHSCGIRTDSLLACWGSNQYGALGIGPFSATSPAIVSASIRFAEVVASDQKTCARTVPGRVMCWGGLWTKTSGDTDFTRIRNTPELVAGAGIMAGIGVGPSSTCAFDFTGFGWCWDKNDHGEGGAGAGPGSVVPRRIRSDDEFNRITVGAAHACGVTTAGAALCWGSNTSGQLGSTTAERCGSPAGACSTGPMPVFGRQRFTSLSAGLGAHTCGVTDHGNLYCWGAGASGQRGDGTRGSRSSLPRLAAGVIGQ